MSKLGYKKKSKSDDGDAKIKNARSLNSRKDVMELNRSACLCSHLPSAQPPSRRGLAPKLGGFGGLGASRHYYYESTCEIRSLLLYDTFSSLYKAISGFLYTLRFLQLSDEPFPQPMEMPSVRLYIILFSNCHPRWWGCRFLRLLTQSMM